MGCHRIFEKEMSRCFKHLLAIHGQQNFAPCRQQMQVPPQPADIAAIETNHERIDVSGRKREPILNQNHLSRNQFPLTGRIQFDQSHMQWQLHIGSLNGGQRGFRRVQIIDKFLQHHPQFCIGNWLGIGILRNCC